VSKDYPLERMGQSTISVALASQDYSNYSSWPVSKGLYEPFLSGKLLQVIRL